MGSEHAARLVEAFARLIGALAWPAALTIMVLLLRPALLHFLSTLSELRVKGRSGATSVGFRRDEQAIARFLEARWQG